MAQISRPNAQTLANGVPQQKVEFLEITLARVVFRIHGPVSGAHIPRAGTRKDLCHPGIELQSVSNRFA